MTKSSDGQAQKQRMNWQRVLRNLGVVTAGAGLVAANLPVAAVGAFVLLGSDRRVMLRWRSPDARERIQANLDTERAVRRELVRRQLDASDAHVKLWARAVLAYALYTFDPDEYNKRLAANQL